MQCLTRGEKKSLAYHEVVAARLRADPKLIEIAQQRLRWHRDSNPAGKAYYDRWERLLSGPLEVLIAAMLDPSPRGCALRQENPFVDLIDQRERAAIYRQAAAAGRMAGRV